MRRKLSRKLLDERDGVRRYGRRGVARAVLEHTGHESYFDTHEIASEFRATYARRKLERWATERNPQGSTGLTVTGLIIDKTHPKAARWP